MKAALLLIAMAVQASPTAPAPSSTPAIAKAPVVSVAPTTAEAKPKEPTRLERTKTIIEIVQSIATIIGIGAGAFWFLKQRKRYPSATLSHTITRAPLGHGQQLLRITVNVCNHGDVLLQIEEARSAIMQITPPPKELMAHLAKQSDEDPVGKNQTEYEWTWLRDREVKFKDILEVEPSEEQQIDWDYFVPDNLEVVATYTYIKNQTKKNREIGWELTTTHDFTKPEGAAAEAEKTKTVRGKGAGR